jgi:phenylacetate-coenzyme A ligase PaaK-like adenylate-forming protein
VRHAADFATRLPDHLERLTWPAERVAEARQQGLRELLAVAVRRSPWHRERLAGLDVANATEADLAAIPTMTKADLMAHFDDIVCVPGVSRDIAEAHLDGVGADPYLLGEHHVVASGGSSGARGVFVYDWEGWLVCALSQQRFRARRRRELGIGPEGVTAVVAGGSGTHMSYAMARTFGRSMVPVPATLPTGELVERLNALQPAVLSGYPSMVSALASEAMAGRLRISPRLVMCASEPLLPETRQRVAEAWSVSVVNSYFTCEGPSASDCGHDAGMHLNADVCVFEPVDEGGRAVRAGERAAKVFVTPLFNHALPLIRYELTDEMTILEGPCPCGSGMARIADVAGRSDDVFTYAGGVAVHPMVFRSILGHERHVVDYQVRQVDGGAAVVLRADGAVDVDGLGRAIEDGLRAVGIPAPSVSVAIVDDLERGSAGKLKRFVPLLAAGH